MSTAPAGGAGEGHGGRWDPPGLGQRIGLLLVVALIILGIAAGVLGGRP